MDNIKDINQIRAEKIADIAVKDALQYSAEELRWKFVYSNDNRERKWQ